MVQHKGNFYTNHIYALSWRIKHAGNKVWSGSKIIDFERWHAIWLRKNVYRS